MAQVMWNKGHDLSEMFLAAVKDDNRLSREDSLAVGRGLFALEATDQAFRRVLEMERKTLDDPNARERIQIQELAANRRVNNLQVDLLLALVTNTPVVAADIKKRQAAAQPKYEHAPQWADLRTALDFLVCLYITPRNLVVH